MKKSQRDRVNKLARRAKSQRLNDSAPRKRQIRHGKRVASKIDVQREYVCDRGNEAIRAKYDHGPVLQLKAETFNVGLDKY